MLGVLNNLYFLIVFLSFHFLFINILMEGFRFGFSSRKIYMTKLENIKNNGNFKYLIKFNRIDAVIKRIYFNHFIKF